MAEFSFYGTWEDSLAWLEMLCQMRRFTFVEDVWYTAPAPHQFTAIDDRCLEHLHKPSRLFLWADAYSRFPPSFFGEPPPDGLLRVDLVRGGPALDLILPACFQRDGRLSVGWGELGHQPEYQNPQTGEWYKAPEALKQAYNELRTLLRKNMVKRFGWLRRISNGEIRPIVYTYWLGRHAATLLDEGKADILVGHEWVWKRAEELYKRKSDMPEPPEDE